MAFLVFGTLTWACMPQLRRGGALRVRRHTLTVSAVRESCLDSIPNSLGVHFFSILPQQALLVWLGPSRENQVSQGSHGARWTSHFRSIVSDLEPPL